MLDVLLALRRPDTFEPIDGRRVFIEMCRRDRYNTKGLKGHGVSGCNIPDWENMEDENEFDITTNGDGEILRSPNIS